MNPAADGIDIAITAFPASFDNVADEFLWPLRRSLFASRQYLSSYRPAPARGAPLLGLPTHWPELAIPKPQRRDDGHRSAPDVQQRHERAARGGQDASRHRAFEQLRGARGVPRRLPGGAA